MRCKESDSKREKGSWTLVNRQLRRRRKNEKGGKRQVEREALEK